MLPFVPVIPYSGHYTHHPSRIVATSDGFKQVKTHAERLTGKCVAVMEARKKRVWNRYGLDNAREMILRQLSDNDCLWMDMCKLNPCVTALVAMICHSSQAAGPGAHDSSTQDGQPDPSDWHELV